MSTPDHMRQFQFARPIAIVKDGALGWPWVSEIVPLTVDAAELKVPQQ